MPFPSIISQKKQNKTKQNKNKNKNTKQNKTKSKTKQKQNKKRGNSEIFNYNNNILSLKTAYFELGHDYDYTVTSYLEFWYLFLVCLKRRDSSLHFGTNYMYLGVHCLVHIWVVLVNCVIKKSW